MTSDESADRSHLDLLYFVDQYKYDCPFCKRRHVWYHLVAKKKFNWTTTKHCNIYFAKCDSCQGEAMHLSFEDIDLEYTSGNYFRFIDGHDIDSRIFYSVPTSFFVLDDLIPGVSSAT